MKTSNLIRLLTVAMVLHVSVVSAQEKAEGAAAPPKPGFRAEYLYQLDDVQKKITDLAQAVPAEKYTWRPAEGVRSISEVYMHIAGANFLFPSFVGHKSPAGLDRDLEKKVTEKAKVLDVLKQSFDHIRQAVMKTPDADLDKAAKFFGHETTVRDIFLTAALHMHEHLGQSIAYARMNGVVPPWTAARESESQQPSRN